METHEKLNILIIDDEKEFTEELSEFFQKTGYNAFEANTAEEGRRTMESKKIDLLILDVRLPGINGLDLLKEIKSRYQGMEVIMISAHGDMDTVIEAIRLGAFDYLRKPFRYADIQIAIERTHKYLQIQRKLKQMEEKNSLISKTLEEKIDRQFIGKSDQILEIFDQAITAAKYPDANVLITGESGTGKENIARIIHFTSQRKDNIFCAVNSSALTETLLESEFFGHKKGSFTGAISDKMGFFEVCNNGTLFLDEIADMPLNLQAKLLRATEEKVITRVGDTKEIHTDFRIISATNQDLSKNVEKKGFRLDLLHRLNTLSIHIPPLRERPEDIKPLFAHFVEVYSKKFNKTNLNISKEVIEMLQKYEFPGNVRELRNLTERAIILCKCNVLGINDFPLKQQKQSVSDLQSESVNLKTSEIIMIRRSLELSKFNQSEAALLLGITRDALIRKMRKYNIRIKKDEA